MTCCSGGPKPESPESEYVTITAILVLGLYKSSKKAVRGTGKWQGKSETHSAYDLSSYSGRRLLSCSVPSVGVR